MNSNNDYVFLHLTKRDSNDRFKAMWAIIVRSDFFEYILINHIFSLICGGQPHKINIFFLFRGVIIKHYVVSGG